jgi:hypothetical protein
LAVCVLSIGLFRVSSINRAPFISQHLPSVVSPPTAIDRSRGSSTAHKKPRRPFMHSGISRSPLSG